MGHDRRSQLRPGLTLHVADTTDLCELKTSIVMPPGMTTYLFMAAAGGLEASIGGRLLPVGRHAQGPMPAAFMIYRAQAAVFVRRAKAGTHVRKVSVTVSQAWLDGTFSDIGAPIPPLARQHLAISRWLPSHRLQLVVERLFGQEDPATAVGRIRHETTALELVAATLASLQPPGDGVPRRSETMTLHRARDIIEARLSEDFHVTEIAAEVRMTEASLQRLFRFHYGSSVMEYARARRLDVARVMLEQDGVTVAEAAAGAGYGSPANFSTAFRRRFGLTPTEVRNG